MKKPAPAIALAALFFACASVVPSAEAKGTGGVDCSLEFSLKGWSAFYKTSKGEGGGITFGKSDVKNGTGSFSKVASIDELLGSYAYAAADAGKFTITAAGATKK